MMDALSSLKEDYVRLSGGLPRPLEAYIQDRYGVSLASNYAGHAIRNPFGKASGQLSLNANQVQRDIDAGLGFIVLKTLIAQDKTGAQSMKAWAIPATHMNIEPVIGTRQGVIGERGWTVTWKGRGWSDTFENYLKLFDRSLEIAKPSGTLIVPSVKFHLPKPGESEWRVEEYEHTTKALFEVWSKHSNAPMPLEKDFSPTLAGDRNFSELRETILDWLRTVPKILHSTSIGKNIRVGLKLFNASHSDDFQLEMLDLCDAATDDARPDYIIYGNRLFDPAREFEGVKGVAYGGPDLSARNLSVLTKWKHELPLSATGNIVTGNVAREYQAHGATSFQMHTAFQLPDTEFPMKGSSRTERALHRLLFHPEHGYLLGES